MTVIGSVDADGLCTLCNRHHDDFAHVVDVNQEGSIIETVRSSPHETRQRQNGVAQGLTHACILGNVHFHNLTLDNVFSGSLVK